MPRYQVARSASSTGKARHQKSFAVGLHTLNAAGTEISDTCSIGANVNVRQVTLSHLAVSYEPPSVAYGDTHCAATGADGYLEAPNAVHCWLDANGDKGGSVCVWVKIPAGTVVVPIICHGTQWFVRLTATHQLEVELRTDASNTLLKTSVETVTAETWTCVQASYSGSKTVDGLTLSIDGEACTYGVDASAGAYTGMFYDGTASTYIGYNGTLYANSSFGDVCLFNAALSSYVQTTLFNSGSVKALDSSCSMLVSRYTMYDFPADDDTAVKDIIGGYDLAVMGTVIDTADGTAVENIGAADLNGNWLVTMYSIPELRSYVTMSGESLGQEYSYAGSWILPHSGEISGGTAEFYPTEREGSVIAVEAPAVLQSFVLKLSYVGSDMTGTGCTLLPRLSWPQAATARVVLEYEEV